MGYILDKLNNIGGSTGKGNLWIYTADGTLAAATADDYFNNAIKQGMRDRDLIIVTGSDGAGLFRIDITGGATVVLTDIKVKP